MSTLEDIKAVCEKMAEKVNGVHVTVTALQRSLYGTPEAPGDEGDIPYIKKQLEKHDKAIAKNKESVWRNRFLIFGAGGSGIGIGKLIDLIFGRLSGG